MKYLFATICFVTGWVAAVTATPVWIIKAIYELIKTDIGFWSIAFSNLGGWVVTLLIAVILFIAAYALAE